MVSKVYYDSMITMLNDSNKKISNPLHDENVKTIKNKPIFAKYIDRFQRVASFDLGDCETFQLRYIPLFADGGVFIPTTRPYDLGQEVYVLMTLPDDLQRYPIVGKVGWITPASATGNRTQGVGVRFPADEKSQHLKLRIEEILGTHLASDRVTQTV